MEHDPFGKPVATFPDHALDLWWSMILSENRWPLFRITLWIFGGALILSGARTARFPNSLSCRGRLRMSPTDSPFAKWVRLSVSTGAGRTRLCGPCAVQL